MREDNNLNPVEPVTPVTPTEPSIEPTPMQTPVVEQTVQPVMQTPVEPQIDPSFGTNVEVPVQPVPTPTKKKSPLPIILIVLVLLAGGGFAIWKFVLPNLNGDSKEPTTTTEEMLAGHVDLTDSDMIKKLNDIIDIHESSSIARIDDQLYKVDGNYLLKDLRKRVYISVMHSKQYDNADLNKIREFTEHGANVYQAIKDGEIGDYNYIPYEEYSKTYKQIYNEDLPNEVLPDVGYAEVDGGVYCPAIYYDANNKDYFFIYACGGDSGVTDLSYKYKYEKELKDGNEYYYVYVAVGFIGSEEADEADGERKYYTYHSYIDTESKEPNEDEGFKIDSSNYEKFDKFKYVFIKDNATGNIYVDHIERVK